MKKTRNILALSCLSIILLTGVNVASACEGLTIGYWKNHTDDWVDYTPDQTLGEVFDIPTAYGHFANFKLEEALRFKGGKGCDGAVRLLFKQAVGALLNIKHPGINYEINLDQLKEYVYNVLTWYGGNDRAFILSLKDALDGWNNAGL